MTVTKTERKPVERKRLPLGWCMTGHHEGHGPGECWSVIDPDKPCVCYCHDRDKQAALIKELRAKPQTTVEPKTKAPAKRPRPKTSGKPCVCGCGETTGGGNYRPGHDSRHVSRVVAGEASLDDLPTEALRAKARKRMET